ncbi:MAG: AAA family ATPase [Chloroflexota bacterium]|nr:AAA family ATPase [Chloroflexota bacterium]
MGNLRTNLRVILIGGSSHAGKSTVSETLAATLGWTSLSTDRLAAHPGRPWRRTPGDKVMDIVAEHYLNLSVDELMEDVLRHYWANVWPKVEELIVSYVGDTSVNGLVLEGSALWPEFPTRLDFNRVGALWLTASEETFRQRIYANSRYSTKSGRNREMVDKFLQRTVAYNTRMVEVVNRLGFNLVDVMDSDATDLAERCLLALGVDGK